MLVATEAAGEGINLQFCWFMINYDIPWNPVRLEQRMGRIHRYGQEKDCLIFNFVSTNTREGRVLQKLFERIQAIEDDLDPRRTGKVFNVLGDVFPANQLERMIRDMYARNLTEEVIKSASSSRWTASGSEQITESTLEGCWPRRELNLSAIIGKSAEAKERRLVPEVIEDFFVQAAPTCRRPAQGDQGRLPRLPHRPGSPSALAHRRTPGAPLRQARPRVQEHRLRQGSSCPRTPPWNGSRPAIRCSRRSARTCWKTPPQTSSAAASSTTCTPARRTASISSRASVKDGRGNQIHRRLFAVQADTNPRPATSTVRQAAHRPPRPGRRSPVGARAGRAIPCPTARRPSSS